MSNDTIKAMLNHAAATADGYIAAKAFRSYRAKCPASLKRLKLADAINILESDQFQEEEENHAHMYQLKQLAHEYFIIKKRVQATFKTLLDQIYDDPVATKEACDDIRFITSCDTKK